MTTPTASPDRDVRRPEAPKTPKSLKTPDTPKAPAGPRSPRRGPRRVLTSVARGTWILTSTAVHVTFLGSRAIP